MKIKVYNLAGKETGEMKLSDDIFDIAVKPEVVHQVYVAQMNNQRQPWADTKTKGEVRGGGRKPWAQKGTGRARHGSIRSPIWKGGGVTFGPLTIRNYKSKLNKKTRRLALKMCLSDKARNGALLAVENFSFERPKTKLFAGFLKALPVDWKSFLVLTGAGERELVRLTRNLKQVRTMRAEDVNVMELLKNQAVIASQEALASLVGIFTKKNESEK